jgi:hypothetical protein
MIKILGSTRKLEKYAVRSGVSASAKTLIVRLKIPQPLCPVAITPNSGKRGPVRGKDVEENNQLKREGLSIRAISKLTGYDRKTIRKYLLKPVVCPVRGHRRRAKLDPFKRI